MTVNNKKYTCIKSGTKLLWNKGTLIKPQTVSPSTTPTPLSSPTPTPTNSPTPIKTSSAIRAYELVPTFSMTAYSEELRRYKDRPDGYLYIHQTLGKVQILLPTLPNQDLSSEYFVVIGGGIVSNRACDSGNLRLPLDARAERDKKSVLYTLLPKGPKGLPVGIVFQVSTFPIAFTCYYGNEIKYTVSVVETDKLSTTIKSQSRAVEFVTPILWLSLPQPTSSPTQIDVFTITPNAVCLPEGTKVNSTDGKSYFCKKSESDGQLRWTS